MNIKTKARTMPLSVTLHVQVFHFFLGMFPFIMNIKTKARTMPLSVTLHVQKFHFFLGMFLYDKKAGVYWFSSAPCENYQEFNLVGVVSFNNKG